MNSLTKMGLFLSTGAALLSSRTEAARPNVKPGLWAKIFARSMNDGAQGADDEKKIPDRIVANSLRELRGFQTTLVTAAARSATPSHESPVTQRACRSWCSTRSCRLYGRS